jgi:hypothetical protein
MTRVEAYLNIVTLYDKEFSKWMNRSDKILRRYRDERTVNSLQTRYNMLWANVQTLKAATFSRMPKADVSRRFKDNDPVGRVASLILERAMDFEIEHYTDFRHAMESAVYDRFLGGRGTAWLRYEPKIESQDTSVSEQDESSDEAAEYLDTEASPVDYVHWKDFGHEVARTWDEVNKVWRKVYLTRKAMVERFGEELGNKIPLDSSPDDQKYKDSDGVGKKGLIIELWDRETKKVMWISKSLNQILDERDDPLQLEEFFPCPKPLYSTITNETLVPIPDFTLYQDQANALDTLSARISGLIDALKVRGVYDASEPTLQRLFTEGENNTLIPVKNWQAFAEKQGLKGAIDIVDITPVAAALKYAYDAMAQLKSEIYDITGISDIIRGQSNIIETATSAQIKSQFASLRLKDYQDDVACFASDILKIKAQIICGQFQPETLIKIGGVEQLSPADQALVPQAIAMLKNNPMRTFRVEVATDSMLYQDEQREKQDRVEFLSAVGQFLEKATQASQMMPPEATPLLMDLLKFGVTGFRIGRTIEGEFDNVADAIKEQSKQPKQPKPDPEMMKLQATMQMEKEKAQINMQTRQAELQNQAQIRQQELQLEAQKQDMQAQNDMKERQHKAELDQFLEQQRLEFDRWKSQLENETKILIAEMDSKTKLKTQYMSAHPNDPMTILDDNGNPKLSDEITNLLHDVNTSMETLVQTNMMAQQANADMVAKQQAAHEMLLGHLSKPKQVLRDSSGKIIGVK